VFLRPLPIQTERENRRQNEVTEKGIPGQHISHHSPGERYGCKGSGKFLKGIKVHWVSAKNKKTRSE
jgi:hypothetical protein